MKELYEKPIVDVIDFQIQDSVMSEDGIEAYDMPGFSQGVEEW